MLKQTLSVIVALIYGAVVYGADLKVRQPVYPNAMDTWYGNIYNKSAMHETRLRDGGWGDEYDTLVRFDLSGLPQTATQAILYLYVYPPGDGSTTTPINWYQLNSQWHTSTVGWDNQPANSFITTTTGPGNQAGWFYVDITSYYNTWRLANPTILLNYGLAMKPQYNNNRFNVFHSSGTTLSGAQPLLYVFYNRQANDSILKLKWPLATTYASRVVNHPFRADWAGNVYCGGLIKKHNGTDFAATAGTAVFAVEDGIVKEVLPANQTSGWASNIVIEHNHPNGGKYTTVYWHVNSLVAITSFVPKGFQIGSVANLGANTHFHFGVRIGSYLLNVSGTGALPQQTCTDIGKTFSYPAFPAGFIDANDTSNVLFQ